MNLKYQKYVITLQNELQFFKDESIRLNKIVKDYKQELNQFKQKYDSAFDDNKFLKEK
jgi:predicted HicB family RNase H-like nuclease